MIINGQALNSLYVGFKTLFNKQMELTPATKDKIATTVPSSTSIEQYAWLGMFPKMREWVGSRVVQALQAHGYTIKNKDFEMTIAVSRSAIDDDTYGIYSPLFSQMGESAKRHPDEIVWECLRNGFTANCYDGTTYFSASHKVGEKTLSNKTTAKLSMDSYKAARTIMMSYTNESGQPLGIIPDLLIVPPQLEAAALEIVNTQYINGTTNPYYQTAKVHVEPELAGKPSNWYLACTTKFIKPIIYQERKKIQFVSLTKPTDPNVFMENQYVYGADGRDAAGYGLWQLCYGGTGENAG